jgi:hypothetical protein
MALEKDAEGTGVLNLQKNLNQLGVAVLKEDGIFGDETFAAVEVFQSAHSLPVTGEVDEATNDEINRSISQQISDDPAPWLVWMKSHIGEAEQTGAVASEFDNEVFSHTSYGNLDGVMEPGCAATACAALEESGFKSPHNAAAEKFRNLGDPCELKPGCVVGFNWKGQKGVHCDHVTFCDHVIDENLVACLGGNQGHQVKVSIFSRKFIDFTNWPVVRLEPISLGSQTATLTAKVEVKETIEKEPQPSVKPTIKLRRGKR